MSDSNHADKPGPEDLETARRRDEVVKRMLATPPQPRAAKKGREPKRAPKKGIKS